MGIGRNRRVVVSFVCAFSGTLLSNLLSSEALERRSGIWRILRAGQFGGAMNEEAQVWPVKGSIVSNGKRYKFWEYQWAESRPSGHGRNLLLVFEDDKGLRYLGSYEFDAYPFHGRVHPEIRGKTVFFPYKDYQILGIKILKEISFENGPPAVAQVGDVGSGEFSR